MFRQVWIKKISETNGSDFLEMFRSHNRIGFIGFKIFSKTNHYTGLFQLQHPNFHGWFVFSHKKNIDDFMAGQFKKLASKFTDFDIVNLFN